MRTRTKAGGRPLPAGLAIIHEDHDILVVDKPSGLLTMGTETERERTAYYILTDYVRKGCAKSRNRVFIVHRLDKDTSGVLVLAKTPQAKHRLQEEWERTEKTYLAVVHGHLEPQSGTVANRLVETDARSVRPTANPAEGKPARSAYRVVKETKLCSLVEVGLLTGRKHQIRVHMAGLGHPVVGDRRYGRRDDPESRLALHAHSIAFDHPHTGRRVRYAAKPPVFFNKLVGDIREFSTPPETE